MLSNIEEDIIKTFDGIILLFIVMCINTLCITVHYSVIKYDVDAQY